MLKYLIQRPIAVFTIALIVVTLGFISINKIPTSLLPNIPIPEITVKVAYHNVSASQLENTIVRPLRNHLLQVSNLKDIQSETRDGSATIKLVFEYGTDIDYSYIETNEKIDGLLNSFPREFERPKVIKASTTDIPIVYLSLNLKKEKSENDFLDLSQLTENVLKKQIEQLPNVAFADVNGLTSPEIIIEPFQEKINSLGITDDEIIKTVLENNFEYSDLLIQNGAYQYHFNFSNPLRDLNDLKNIFLQKNNTILQLKDIAKISLQNQENKGIVYFNGKRAINIAIIKQADARVDDLEQSLMEVISSMKDEYKSIEFNTHSNQAELLELAINNLLQSLVIGSLLTIIVMFFFIEDLLTSFIISITVPVSLLLSFIFLYWFNISINIISLAGLILGVGNMIDNGIIVIDNVSQRLQSSNNLVEACTKGAEELITPMISSVLTTCMIFLPLIFLSGISGALFFDQAIAVTIGLCSSFLVSIFFIPIVFYSIKKRIAKRRSLLYIKSIENWHDRGYHYFFAKIRNTYIIIFLVIVLGVIAGYNLTYQKLPDFNQSETVLTINWNENISLSENSRRVETLNHSKIIIYLPELGEKQYFLNREQSKNVSEATIYIKTQNRETLEQTKKEIENQLKKNYQLASFSFGATKNLFEYIFGSDENQLVANIYSKKSKEVPKEKDANAILSLLELRENSFSLQKSATIEIDFEKLKLYNVSYNDLIGKIKSSFNQYGFNDLKSSQKFIPIKLSSKKSNINTIFEQTFVMNQRGQLISLQNIVKIKYDEKYKSIFGDQRGGKLVAKLDIMDQSQISKIEDKFVENRDWEIQFTGNNFDLEKLKGELFFVFFISILLLYFIMAAQFESLLQPLIILIEIPIDICASLIFLYLFGESINIMSIIGIIIMSGIIINDSIFKIHTFNVLIKEGLPIRQAIKVGGKMRLKSILMTSLTTILAMLPVMLGNGMGNVLQKPLAITLIGGMIVGTFVSLYFVPFVYYLIYKDSK